MSLFEYLASLDTHDRLVLAVVLAVVFGLLALLIVACAHILWMQLRDELAMRRGMQSAWRRGLIRDGDQ